MKLIMRTFRVSEFNLKPEYIRKVYELVEPVIPYKDLKELYNIADADDFECVEEFIKLINSPFDSGKRL